MDCRKAEPRISDYINKKMDLKELREFIAHVKNCPACYDELQTYYMVYFAMKHLGNGESSPSYNMNTVLLEDLKHREQYVIREVAKRWLLSVGGVLLFFLVMLLLLA